MRFTVLLFLLLSVLSFSQKSDADTSSNYFLFDYIDSLKSEDYHSLLAKIKTGESRDFFTLRMAFTKTDKYSAYALPLPEKEMCLKYIEADSLLKAEEAALKLIEHRYVDIPAHMYLGYIYKKMGQPEKSDYHYNIYNSLLASIETEANGISPERAFIVINTKEEYQFLNWYNLRFIEQSLIYKEKYAFDLMKCEAKEDTTKFEIYFNVTIPIYDLERKLNKSE